jgi:hypothetical protein
MKQILWILTLSLSLLFCETPLFPIVVDGKLGYIDSTGKVVIEPKFEYHPDYYNYSFPFFSEGLFAYEKDSLFGYFDTLGNVVITPQFNYAEYFKNGFAKVNIGGNYGEYGEGWSYIEGGKWGFINKKGEFVVQPIFEIKNEWDNLIISTFIENLAAVPNNINETPHWGFIDTLGNWVIKPQFDKVTSFVNGKAIVTIDCPQKIYNDMRGGTCGVIDKSGKYIIQPFFEQVSILNDRIVKVKFNSKWGTIDYSGNFIIQPQFSFFSDFVDGVARVCIDNKWGLIDTTGKYILTPQYAYIAEFSEGLAAFLIATDSLKCSWYIDEFNSSKPNAFGSFWGYIDRNGTEIIPAQYVFAFRFSEGLAIAGIPNMSDESKPDTNLKYRIFNLHYYSKYQLEEGNFDYFPLPPAKICYINKKGKVIIATDYDECAEFYQGYAKIKVDDKLGVINKQGKLVIKPKYDYMEIFRYGYALVNNGGHHEEGYGWTGGKWGYVSKTGKTISLKFEEAGGFVDGIARVCIDTLQNKVHDYDRVLICGYIDTLGNWVWKPTR